MTQFTDKSQQTTKPATQQSAHALPKPENASLSAQTSKLNLSVKVPPKASAGPKLDTVQMKSNPQAGAEPGQITDADVINTVTHLVKAATVHPLGSSSANRELRNQKANLDNNKEQRTKATDQAAKNQQVIEQDKIQQKNTVERTNSREGAGQAGKESKVDVKTDRVIKQQVVKSDAVTEHKPAEALQREVQRFKEEHARSQSASNANVSALASRNTSIEGEKESLSKDLSRERTSEKKPAAEVNVEVLKSEIKDLLTRVNVESKQAENRVIEVQRQVVQAATLTAQVNAEPAAQESEEDIFDSWISRDDRKRVVRKKKETTKQQLARASKRALRKMTPLERRKAKMKQERMRKMRKRSRRRNRSVVFR